MVKIHTLICWSVAAVSLSLAIVLLFTCTTTNGETRRVGGTIPLWKTVQHATLVPTVTPSSTPLPSQTPDPANPPTPTPTPTQTPTPTVTPSPTLTPEPLTQREAYCRAYALPTSTSEAEESPTPVPTSPPGISGDQIPEQWAAKMHEIEAWVREFYEVDDDSIGDINRLFVDDDVWLQWRADAVEDWGANEQSDFELWEQINRTLTLLPADADYAEFMADYQGESYIGLYNPIKREIVVRSSAVGSNLELEMVYVHEYAHHVQHEKYDPIEWRECIEDDGDARRAYTAMLEGDARHTEYTYIEDVIGWGRLRAYAESFEYSADALETRSAMKRYMDEINDFTYSDGWLFVALAGDYLHELAECPNCHTVRQRIDEAFKRPPFTSEHIYDIAKYFIKEGREAISLPSDMLGSDWDSRHGSSVGMSEWVALLTALSGEEIDDVHEEFAGWRGDFGVLFENELGQALHLQVARWADDRYITRLANAFDAQHRLREQTSRSGDATFDDYHLWKGDTGYIALAVEHESARGFYAMFLAVGPDFESVDQAVRAAHADLY